METQQGPGSLSWLPAEQFHCSCSWGKRQPSFLTGLCMDGGDFLHKTDLCGFCASVKPSPWEALGGSLFLLSWVVQGKSPAEPHPAEGLPALGWLWAVQGEWEQTLCPGMGSYRGRNWWDVAVGLQGSALGCFVSAVVSSASLEIWRFQNHPLVVTQIKEPILTPIPQPCSDHSSQGPKQNCHDQTVLGHHKAAAAHQLPPDPCHSTRNKHTATSPEPPTLYLCPKPWLWTNHTRAHTVVDLNSLGQPNTVVGPVKDAVVHPDEDISQDPEVPRGVLEAAHAKFLVVLR